jgi:hypothetical protein
MNVQRGIKEKSVEYRMRRILARHGCRLIKSRATNASADNQLGYMIVDVENNAVIDGSRFELDLADVIKYAEAQQAASNEAAKGRKK